LSDLSYFDKGLLWVISEVFRMKSLAYLFPWPSYDIQYLSGPYHLRWGSAWLPTQEPSHVILNEEPAFTVNDFDDTSIRCLHSLSDCGYVMHSNVSHRQPFTQRITGKMFIYWITSTEDMPGDTYIIITIFNVLNGTCLILISTRIYLSFLK
jgi:hypothetical protein